MRRKIILTLAMASALAMEAQESQTVYNFLRLPVSAHAAALGGDNVSLIEDDPSLMWSNPALISSVSDKSINLNFMTYMQARSPPAARLRKSSTTEHMGSIGTVYELRKHKADERRQ